MQIQIVNVEKIQKSTAKGNGYVQLDVAYKNLTFGNKLESRKIMPFGTQEPIHKIFSAATAGQVYDVEQGKNAGGYNEFTSAQLSDGTAQAATNAPQRTAYQANQPAASSNAPTGRASTFETPEERAAKQIYIVRQSSLSTAVAALSVGTKSAPDAQSVIEYAKQLEKYVFAKEEDVKVDTLDASGFGDMDDDVPL